jgi:tetratricopeptide (TPR) repeat protein
MIKLFLLLIAPALLYSERPDRVTKLVETMRQLTFAGDQFAVGRLVPELIHELANPHPQAALGWNQIGVYHAVQGNFAEAEIAYQRGIRLVERAATGRETLALLLLNLSELYLDAGSRVGQAEKIVRRALNLAEELYAADAARLSHFVYALAVAQNQAGNRRGARSLFQRALLLAGQTGDGKFERGLILANLAVLLAEDKHWQEARETILQAIDSLKQTIGVAHPQLVPTYLNLARIERHFKHWDLAIAALERARVITETQLGPEHGYMVGILESSAFVLRKTGRHSEAKEQARRAKRIASSLQRSTVGTAWIHVADLRP